jgi:predicted esterase
MEKEKKKNLAINSLPQTFLGRESSPWSLRLLQPEKNLLPPAPHRPEISRNRSGMPGRLPARADFASNLVLSIAPPPAGQAPVNVLVLLHGIGDTNAPFTDLGKQLSLPETACLSLQAPTPLPFDLGGFHWGDDIVFDAGGGGIDPDAGFGRATALICTEVIGVLVGECGYRYREIILLGYGQGGMAALAATLSLPPAEELGGVISIGGPLPAGSRETGKKNKTPVLVLGGSSQTLVTGDAIAKVKSAFEFVEAHRYRRPGDTMPRSRDEMMPVMLFLSRRLRSRAGVPEGSVEVG